MAAQEALDDNRKYRIEVETKADSLKSAAKMHVNRESRSSSYHS